MGFGEYNYGEIIGNGGFIAKYKNSQFRESIGEYTFNNVNADDDESSPGTTITRENKKRVIIYTLID